MNLARTWAVTALELRQTAKRPMLWFLLGFMWLMVFGFSAGNVTIDTGNSAVGGQKAWINSETQISVFFITMSFLFYAFFVAVAAGMTVLRDDEIGTSEILHTTPLRPSEYVWGKFLGVVLAFLGVIALHVFFFLLHFQWLPIDNAEEIRGPFRWGAYLRPALLFALPNMLFFAGTAFAVGERTRRAILVFFLPVALLLVSLFFLWNWNPSWLDPRIQDLLMIIEPSGRRWLDQTWISVDRGVEVYNQSPVELDWRFWANRVWVLLAGLGAVLLSVGHARRTIAGDAPPSWIGRAFGRLRRRSTTAARVVDEPSALDTPRLDVLAMRSGRPSWLTSVRTVMRSELQELRNQPGLYLFVPLILVQVIGQSLFSVGAFDTPRLVTAGSLAISTMGTLTTLVCLLLMFYTVESLERERGTGFGQIFYATPLRTSAILFGKALANSVVGAVIVLGALTGAVIILAFNSPAPLELWPFIATWGLLLVPTFLFWTAFVTLVYAVVGNRYSAYAASIGAIVGTAYLLYFTEKASWVWNWPLWSAVQWTDLGTFPLNGSQLLLNRITVLGATAFCTALAVRMFARRDWDVSRSLHRLRPRAVLGTALRLLPVALVPIVAGGVLASQVRNGFQSDAAEREQKDYWRKNLATYRDAPIAAISHVDLDVELSPAERAFTVAGSYEMVNEHDEELREITLTVNPRWQDFEWKLDGQVVESEDREGLHVLTPRTPLQPGESVTVGFSHRGRHPDGATRNGGGSSTFIVEAGVVLHMFGPNFLPIPGYLEGIGVDQDNAFEPRDYPEDFWEEPLDTAFGTIRPFTSRVEVTAPAEFTVNSVGVLTDQRDESDGRRTVVWETTNDHPVKLLNIVAGRYEVKREGGTAVFYDPQHAYNVDEMSMSLQAAREHYSEWFYPFPWKELKLSEFAGLATYAQGFPTNITFSEGIGFLTESDERARAAFMVTAHEAAHQWWGNLLTPGNGPGGNVLSEGMAHYSTLLLHEEEYGLEGRINFAKIIETRYGRSRVVDSERPLVKIDGSRSGDTTVTYDKGGWVMWMLHDLMGRDNALAGLQAFMNQYVPATDDHPVLQDLLVSLRPFAPDQEAFDAFTEQWYFDVVVPEYKLDNVETSQQGDRWVTTFELSNVGSSTMPVEIAAFRGERFDTPGDEDGEEDAEEPFAEARTEALLAAGQSIELEITSDFEPDRVLVDPDARVLQLNRDRALVRL